MMDIPSHTRYSNCGIDEPEAIAEAALAGGITLFGICDHNYGIGERLEQYKAEIAALREAYAGRMRILTGIEIASVPNLGEPNPERLTDLITACWSISICRRARWVWACLNTVIALPVNSALPTPI